MDSTPSSNTSSKSKPHKNEQPILDLGHRMSNPCQGCNYQVYLSLYWEEKLKAIIEADYIQYLSNLKDRQTADPLVKYMNACACNLFAKETDEVKVQVERHCKHHSSLADDSSTGIDVNSPEDELMAAKSNQICKAKLMDW